MSVVSIDITKVSNEAIANGVILDTNALLWTFYPNSSPSAPQAPTYSNFIADLISKNVNIFILSCNLSEAVYVVEKIEYRIYKKISNTNLSLKDYRKIQSERTHVKSTIELMLAQIKAISQISIVDCKDEQTEIYDYVSDFDAHLLDYYDYKISAYSQNNNIPIVTDDADFISNTKSITIVTGNNKVLAV